VLSAVEPREGVVGGEIHAWVGLAHPSGADPAVGLDPGCYDEAPSLAFLVGDAHRSAKIAARAGQLFCW
jgi:hypothetical protein